VIVEACRENGVCFEVAENYYLTFPTRGVLNAD